MASKGAKTHSNASANSQPLTDVVFVDKDGGRTLYFCEGNKVIIQKCLAIEGAINSREDCKGLNGARAPEWTAEKDFFIASLKARLRIDGLSDLKGMTAEALKKYSAESAEVVQQQVEYVRLKAQVDRLQEYLDEVGPRNKEKYEEMTKLKEKLGSFETFLNNNVYIQDLIKRVNAEVDPLIAAVCDPKVMKKYAASFGPHDKTILQQMLEDYSPAYFECGKSGSKEARLRECKTTAKIANFEVRAVRVDKDKSGANQIWWDVPLGEKRGSFILSPKFGPLNYKEAQEFCGKQNPGLNQKCQLLDTSDFFQALNDKKIDIATTEKDRMSRDFKLANIRDLTRDVEGQYLWMKNSLDKPTSRVRNPDFGLILLHYTDSETSFLREERPFHCSCKGNN